jgi:hypothetical protein
MLFDKYFIEHLFSMFMQNSGADDSKTESEIADNDNDDTKDATSTGGGGKSSNNNNSKDEKATSLYPPDWWWAERQVNEILAEHPGRKTKVFYFYFFHLFVE